MCGILGSVGLSFDLSHLNLIQHRGPDDFGVEKFELNGHQILLAHRRLSIIDLSQAGHQPMISDCGQFALVFNGEIYNHQELRKMLPDAIAFQGRSDTETILYYLREFGIDCVKDLNGIFSFAFLDKKRKELFLVRDPFGVKPLYYSYNHNPNHSIVFSSELRPIKSIIKDNNINKEALATLLRLRYNPAPDTLHAQIKKVRPGHYLKINFANGVVAGHHHAYINKIPEVIHRSSENLVELYGKKLEEAVKRQLLADVEIGVLLSGGIDSALMAALAQRHSGSKLKAFTIGFEGNYTEDEIEDAAETAQILGLEHYFKRITFPDFLKMMKECIEIVEEPLATTSMIPMFFLSGLASKHVKVVLTGQGADELLGGYGRYRSELLREKIPAFLYSLAKSITRNFRIRNEKFSKGLSSLRIQNDIDRFLAIYEVFSPEDIQKLISISSRDAFDKISYFYNLLDCKNMEHAAERIIALDSRLNLADDLLNYTDKITMKFSIECRVPMLDLELVNFIESLPLSLKLNFWTGKLIHKQFAKKIIPPKIIDRKKKGFLSPTRHWFKNQPDLITELLLKKGTHFSEIFNQNYVSKIIEMHQDGYNKEKHIFLLLNIYFWLENISKKQ